MGTWISWRHFCAMSLCLHHSGGVPNEWFLLIRNENMPENLSTFASPSVIISWAKADLAPEHMWSSVGAILTFLWSTWKCIEVSGVVTMMGWHQFSSVQSLSRVRLFATPWITACQASLSIGSQREELRPWQRSWGGKLGICKGVIKPQETPCSRASTPKTRVLYGELSPITISLREGVNLQLQLIKIPGRDKSVSTYKLWRFSGLPDQARPAACDCLQPPNCERHGMF